MLMVSFFRTALIVAVAASEIANVIRRHHQQVQAHPPSHWLVAWWWMIRQGKLKMSTHHSHTCYRVWPFLSAEVSGHWQCRSLVFDLHNLISTLHYSIWIMHSVWTGHIFHVFDNQVAKKFSGWNQVIKDYKEGWRKWIVLRIICIKQLFQHFKDMT